MPEFTPQQQNAIEYKNLDACVIAGPGSGKTTVLVERYRSLIEEHRFEPRNILAITFTEKAAANMKSKLAEAFAHDAIRLRDLETAWVSTIHGFCARLLKENSIAAGIDPRFSVLDAREAEDLQFSCLNAALDEMVLLRRGEALELIDVLQTPYISGDLRNAYDGLRSAGKSIAEIRAMANPGVELTPQGMADKLKRLLQGWPANLSAARQKHKHENLEWAQRLAEIDPDDVEGVITVAGCCPLHMGKVPESEKEVLKQYKEEELPYLRASVLDRYTAPFRALIFDVLTRFDELYSERKLQLGALDFNDLERRAVDLLRQNADVRTRVRSQFRQVMLDEFQDINQQQSDLIELVRGEDVFFAVGDINQSIYGFRHAQPEIFHRYRLRIDDTGKHSASLLHNFRSRSDILRCVELLLNSAEGIDPRELIAGASFSDKLSPSIEVWKVFTAEEADDPAVREARWIAHRVRELHGRLQVGDNGKAHLADYSDFAVLCRNGDSMKPILEAFERARIPYVSGRRQSFLLSREGRDITALLHVIANPRDAIALSTVLRSSLVGIGDESLLRLRLMANSVPGGLNMIASDGTKLAEFTQDDAAKLGRFAANLKRWRTEQPVSPLEALLVRALTDCGFEWVPNSDTANNIESYLHLARTRGAHHNLDALLREIESLENAVNLESDLSDKDQGNAVQVMTAHAAKGLEFPVTIIAAMDKATQRNTATVSFTPKYGLGLTWKDRYSKNRKAGLKDSWQLRNYEEISEREKQESNRLLYVAATRAEEHLILSFTKPRNPSPWARMVDSRFQVNTFAPSAEPYRSTVALPNFETFDVSLYVKDTDPPEPAVLDSAKTKEAGIITIARPEVVAQHDTAVNVTSLAIFADCPRKYYLQRYIGWNGRAISIDDEDLGADNGDSADDVSAADLGSAVHEILAGKPGEYPEEAQRLANVFLQSELGAHASTASQSAREWDFIVDIDGTLVRGSIDLWFKKNDEFVIVDYKTDKDARPEAYAPQLALYGMAIERAFGKRPVRAILHFLRSNRVIEVPLDYDVNALLVQLRNAQDALSFDLNAGVHCRSCQFYRSLCPAA